MILTINTLKGEKITTDIDDRIIVQMLKASNNDLTIEYKIKNKKITIRISGEDEELPNG